MEDQILIHWGILGMKWGVRRYQNPDGTLTELGKAREAKQRAKEQAKMDKKDLKWVDKKGGKIYAKALKESKKELIREDAILRSQMPTRNKDGSVNKAYALAFNQKMADIMNTKVSDLKAPSGRVLRFVAKRGEIGVHTALADVDYDMSQVRRGVYGGKKYGKIAYKKQQIEVK